MAYINGKKVLFTPKVNVTQIKGLDTSDIEDLSNFAMFDKFNDRLDSINTASCKNFNNILAESVELTEAPDWNTSQGVYFDSMFTGCTALTVAPQYDFKNGEMFCYTFNRSGITEVPDYNLENAKDTNNMFSECAELKTVGVINIPNVESCSNMFNCCMQLETVAGLDISNATGEMTADFMFYWCEQLKNLTINGEIKVSFDVSSSPLLTVESLTSIINALADVTEDTTTRWLYLGYENNEKLTEEQIAIIANKGWVNA